MLNQVKHLSLIFLSNILSKIKDHFDYKKKFTIISNDLNILKRDYEWVTKKLRFYETTNHAEVVGMSAKSLNDIWNHKPQVTFSF